MIQEWKEPGNPEWRCEHIWCRAEQIDTRSNMLRAQHSTHQIHNQKEIPCGSEKRQKKKKDQKRKTNERLMTIKKNHPAPFCNCFFPYPIYSQPIQSSSRLIRKTILNTLLLSLQQHMRLQHQHSNTVSHKHGYSYNYATTVV